MADAAKWFHSGTRSIARAAEKNTRPGEIGPGAVGDREDHHRVAEAAPIHTKLSWVAVAVAIWFLSLTASNAQKINTTQKSSRSMTSQVKFQPASVQAQPDLKCILYPSGGLPSSGLAVYTDEDGYARFHAIPASGKAEGKQLTLNCTNTAGKPFRYTVDLSSANTFTPRPLSFANMRGRLRQALTGDPLRYPQEELIRNGYGVRPDPKKSPEAYAQWKQAAMVVAKFPGPNVFGINAPKTKLSLTQVEAKPRLRDNTSKNQLNMNISYGTSSWWVGSLLQGAPQYDVIQASFNVPSGIPGGGNSTTTGMVIWGGLGTSFGLIQGGVIVQTSPTAAVYGTFHEYCCGDTAGIAGGQFAPSPGDQIYMQAWYCDAQGNVNISGGYGCVFVLDSTAQKILYCAKAGESPCSSVPLQAMGLPPCPGITTANNCFTLGNTADFIIENTTPQLLPNVTTFTPFSPSVTISGFAHSIKTDSYSHSISTDPNVVIITETKNNPSHISVDVGNTNETHIAWHP